MEPESITCDSSEMGKEILKGVADQWEKGQFCDVQIEVDGQTIPCHRTILAASCFYFRNMLLGGFKESKERKVKLEGINFKTLEAILRYVYYQELKLSDGNVEDVLCGAHLIQLDALITLCEAYLIDNLSNETYFGCQRLFEKYSLKKGEEEVNNYILENFVALSKTADFLDMPKESFCSYLGNENLGVSEELEVFRAAKAWLEHEEDRMEYCSEIMKHISFAFIPTDALTNEVKNASFMQQDKKCMDLLLETLRYHSNLYTQPSYVGSINKLRGKSSLLVVEGGTMKTRGGYDLYQIEEVENPAWIIKLDKIQEKYRDVKIGVPFAYDSVSLVEYNNFLYLFGVDNRSFCCVSMRYDGNTDQWIDLAPMPSKAVAKNAVSRIGDTIVVTGGLYISMSDMRLFQPYKIQAKTYLYDISTNRWKSGTPCPDAVAAPAFCTYKDLVYVAGGFEASADWSKRMWAYNESGDVWLAKPEMAVEKIGPVMNVVADKLLLIDGQFDSVELFDAEVNQWTTIEIYQNDMYYGVSSFVFNNALYLIGGDQGLVSDVIGHVNTDGDFGEMEGLFKTVGINYCAVLRIK